RRLGFPPPVSSPPTPAGAALLTARIPAGAALLTALIPAGTAVLPADSVSPPAPLSSPRTPSPPSRSISPPRPPPPAPLSSPRTPSPPSRSNSPPRPPPPAPALLPALPRRRRYPLPESPALHRPSLCSPVDLAKMDQEKVNQSKANWDAIAAKAFCEICAEQTLEGNRPTAFLSTTGYKNLERDFFQRTRRNYTRRQFKNRWDAMKALYSAWKYYRGRCTGWVGTKLQELLPPTRTGGKRL
ncbi:hypothetical protein BRADI_4g01595v3, partial [Brachypodium distachyon]